MPSSSATTQIASHSRLWGPGGSLCCDGYWVGGLSSPSTAVAWQRRIASSTAWIWEKEKPPAVCGL
jgi:hypothetical protein